MYPELFNPINIVNITVPNRIVMPPMHLGYADEEGIVTNRLIDFYAERARGGAGLITVGAAYVHPGGKFMKGALGIYDRKCLPGLVKLNRKMQAYGAITAIQLAHGGAESPSWLTGTQPVAPSSIRGILSREIARELSVNEIGELIQGFARAAELALEAGFNIVEIHCLEDFLVHEFLSPHSNKRSDVYGGKLEGRLHFLEEIIGAVREVVGRDYPISCRIPADELVRGGGRMEPQEWKIIATYLERFGVNMLSVTQGCNEATVPQIYMTVPQGAFVYLAQGIKEIVNLPVITSTRINDPALANEIVRLGKADLVAMGRALIADPYLPVKAKMGKQEDIRKCIACNQGCFDAIFVGDAVRCLVNAQAGQEEKLQIKQAPKRKKVTVVGGGPGGLEAARVAALRGHEVTLYERGPSLGGQLLLAARVPGKTEIYNFINYLVRQLQEYGVQVFLNTEATYEAVLRENPDAVVLATGSDPLVPQIPGIEGNPYVVSARDVLSGKVTVGKRAVIVGGGAVGCDTAIYLAYEGGGNTEVLSFLVLNGVCSLEEVAILSRSGRQVTVLEQYERIGADIGRSSRWIILKELRDGGVELRTNARVTGLEENRVIVEVEGRWEILHADHIVLACGAVPRQDLTKQFTATGVEVYLVGDCIIPDKALKAIYEGFEIGNKI